MLLHYLDPGGTEELDIPRQRGPVHADAVFRLHPVQDLVGGQRMGLVGVLPQHLIQIEDAKAAVALIKLRIAVLIHGLLLFLNPVKTGSSGVRA